MILTLKCPKGGRPLSGYSSVDIDKETSIAGYKIGYIPKEASRGEPIIIPLKEWAYFRNQLGLENRARIGLKTRLKAEMVKWLTKDDKNSQTANFGLTEAK